MNESSDFLQGRPQRLLAWLLVAATMFHLALATGTGLSPDEAHYALYGAHPDWSYFDHPALVGWLQAPFVRAGGSDLQMRIVPITCWLCAAALLIALSRQLSAAIEPNRSGETRWDGLWSVTFLFLSPLLNLLGVVLVPDSLLMPLVPAAMMATWGLRAPEATRDWRRWAALGLILGLVMLAKYTGIFIVLAALATLWSFHGRRLIRMGGAGLAAALVTLLLTPIVLWNAQHGWISLAYQGGHAAGDQPWHFSATLRALGLQLLLFGILIPVSVARGCRAADPALDHVPSARRDARRMGLLFGLPVLLVFLCLAGRGGSLPHWTVCGWTALIPLAVVGARDLRRATAIPLAVWQATLLAAIAAVIATGGPFAEASAASALPAGMRAASTQPNPVADLYGWSSAAVRASALAARYHARGMVVMNWSLASRLGWYARPLPVFVAPPRLDQFQLWYGALQTGDTAIVVDWSGMPLPIPVGSNQFDDCAAVDQMAVFEHGRQISHFNFLLCRNWDRANHR